MELKNNSNYYENIKNKSNEQIDGAISKIDEILKEFEKAYVQTKLYPENQENQNLVDNLILSINETQTDLNLLSNNLSQNINKLNDKINKENEKIKIMKNKNEKINSDLKNVKQLINTKNKENVEGNEFSANAADQIYQDYKDKYDINYLRNWGLGLSGVFCIYIISKMFNKNYSTLPTTIIPKI